MADQVDGLHVRVWSTGLTIGGDEQQNVIDRLEEEEERERNNQMRAAGRERRASGRRGGDDNLACRIIMPNGPLARMPTKKAPMK